MAPRTAPSANLSFSFATAINLVGWDAVTNLSSAVTVKLYSTSGGSKTLIESHAFTTPSGSVRSFIGLSNTTAFNLVEVSVAGVSVPTHAMNDLRFEALARSVPLPPAASMGLGLLVGIALLGRRRRRRALP